ncbi:MAG: hypothetical protein KDK37_08470, partial [Leptospiraceae bacterium]|nr:hypothetical protein [Leptospiraceae bacterium]
MVSLAFDPYNLVLALIFSMVLQAVFFVFAAWLKTDKVTDLTYSLTFFLMALGLLLNRTDASRSHVLL